MTGSASVLPSGAGLVVNVHEQGWSFALRRADLRSADIFASYHGKELGGRDVVRFLPDWRSLNWAPVPRDLLSRLELSAIDHEYQVSLFADSTREMQHDELIEAFRRFME